MGQSSSDTILPNTYVAGQNFGGFNIEEAEEALSDMEESWASSSEYLVFSVETGDSNTSLVFVPVNYLSLDVEATVEKILEERLSTGDGLAYVSAIMGSFDITAVFADTEELDKILSEEVDARVGTVLVESSAIVVEDALEITKGVTGRRIDHDEIKEGLISLAVAGDVRPINTTTAQFTVTALEQAPEELDFALLYEEIAIEAVDAMVDEETGAFVEEILGLTFDVAEAQSAFDALKEGESTTVPLEIVEPAVTLASMEEEMFGDVLATVTTTVSGTDNRASNVALAASSCDGIILNPGEEFSYNGIVGSRTTEAGYLPAPAYVAGETVSEIGGGICQVSSTLYYAALLANLEIVERANHGYAVGYVPNGLDATVYYGLLDFRFANNYDTPIKLELEMVDRKLTVTIYGKKVDDTTVVLDRSEGSYVYPTTVYQIDDSVAVGTTVTSVTAYTGCTVTVYRSIYEGDTLISSEFENKSVYKSRDKVVLVNSADAYLYGIEGAVAPEEDVPAVEEVPSVTEPETTVTPDVSADTDTTDTPETTEDVDTGATEDTANTTEDTTEITTPDPEVLEDVVEESADAEA